jgi:hypothetical protein
LSDTSEARTTILIAVNNFRLAKGRERDHMAPLLSERHINQAVAVARHNSLVDDKVLIAAGFRAR